MPLKAPAGMPPGWGFLWAVVFLHGGFDRSHAFFSRAARRFAIHECAGGGGPSTAHTKAATMVAAKNGVSVRRMIKPSGGRLFAFLYCRRCRRPSICDHREG
jgi:hypothetical protein